MKKVIKIDIRKDIADKLIDRKTMLFAHETAYKLMFDFIPFDTGTLAETATVKAEGIHFDQPYASTIYYGDGFNFKHDKHPLATSRWDDAMISARGQKLIKSIENYIKARC